VSSSTARYPVRCIGVVSLRAGRTSVVVCGGNASGYWVVAVLDQTGRISGRVGIDFGLRPTSRSGTSAVLAVYCLFSFLVLVFVPNVGGHGGSQTGCDNGKSFPESAL
jgi:hypothetical protein